ncbi:hypothetical protein WHR41_04325 [Cladosporium halotolerans]|uniref:Uncharacterized protein n=1 Tax=Cladosporium halotolerans TaxID=1052096 RepID=A0AB34KQ01_9PEZI
MVTVDPVRAGLVVAVTKEEPTDASSDSPTIYTATQIPTVNSLPDPVADRADLRRELSWGFGPVNIVGYIDTQTLEIGVSVSVFGARILNLFGNLKNGVVGKIDLFLAKGEVRLFLKNRREVWVKLHLKVTFDGTFDREEKIFSF